MATNSSIEWTEATWNPLTGCTKISPGCKHCYAERLSARLQAMGNPNYANGFELTLHDHVVELPLKWKKPRVIFVNSMSDLFHKDVPVEFVLRVFETMRRASWHTFQVLTKRSDRLLELDPQIVWPANVWMGVSVENENYVPRVEDLRQTHAQTKFLSVEPLLGPLPALNLQGIDWVIVGGESGTRSASNARGVGDRRARPVSGGRGRLFLQAVGAASTRSVPDACWKDAPGTICPRLRSIAGTRPGRVEEPQHAGQHPLHLPCPPLCPRSCRGRDAQRRCAALRPNRRLPRLQIRSADQSVVHNLRLSSTRRTSAATSLA